ncbi:MAG TPA: SDR family oxidoreductase [Chitinophagaceae bacterium]|nr:SDR family oxidoreductase [Chitinophagaceae bacterium]
MNIVITGASKGIGKAIAEAFAEDKQGHSLFLCARDKETLQMTGKELQGRFPRTSVYTRACDVGVKAEVKQFGEWIMEQADKIDILINNAGPFIPGNVYDEEEGALEQMMSVHLFGAYHLTRILIPGMIRQNSGHIFNICSIAAIQAYPGGGSYSISKSALSAFSKNLRYEMKPFGVKVTAVYPGAAFTDSWKDSGIEAERMMKAEDIAKMIYSAAMLSPQACVEEIILRPQLGDV